MSYTTETHRRVYDDKNGSFITVRPDCDGLGLIEIDGGKDYGRVVLDADHAREVAKAILSCAQELQSVAA